MSESFERVTVQGWGWRCPDCQVMFVQLDTFELEAWAERHRESTGHDHGAAS